jgi:hypothetical protein
MLICEVLLAILLIGAFLLAYSDIDSWIVLLSRAEYVVSHYVSPFTLHLIEYGFPSCPQGETGGS